MSGNEGRKAIRATVLECIRRAGDDGVMVADLARMANTNASAVVTSLYSGDMIYEERVRDEKTHQWGLRMYWCGK